MHLVLVFLFLACVCISGVTSVSHVPVLLWSSESSVWASAPAVNGGHITLSDELHGLLQEVVSRKGSIVIFLQDTLSMDDITYYSTVSGSENPLYNVQGIMDSSPSSLVLPAVEWRTIPNLHGYLKSQADWNLISVDNLNEPLLDLDYTKPNLIMINLQPIPRSNQISAVTAFSENDKHIAKITKTLQDSGVNFTAIYTGLKPSKVAKSFDVVQKHGRQLLATDVTVPYPPLNVTNGTDTCILLYATKFVITANSTAAFDLTNVTFGARTANTSQSQCSDYNTTLSLIYSSPGNGLTSLEVRFVMTNMFYTGSARNWFKLESVLIIPNQDILRNASFQTSYASSPAEYSYHCQEVGTSYLTAERLVPTNTEANNWLITITEFQIQGFNIKNNLFSYASDCSSFFTPAIWMGLVSTVILLWILSYGILMIMQLTTNDKFDDPKGPALSVPQGD
ncbi:PREDICTED: V-type proton ATPase subunit S1-like [Nanorana parkeri]|uniref:V-type proton ATPase subunit S1-like n=1 Tax=Nanorana parkeri TaxID=125878 RepID=UPI000854DD48|nr:PREDICTED: V-type proton ATPase subunit S1-like [Nanorana parkeri]